VPAIHHTNPLDNSPAASAEELHVLLRQFQQDQASVTREYQKLLVEKEGELAHFRAALETNGIAVPETPKLPAPPSDTDETGGGGGSAEAAARVKGALREQRQAERIKQLEAIAVELTAKVAAHERNIVALEKERESLETERSGKERTIEELVVEYSQLSGEMREASERDLTVIAELEQERGELATKLADFEGRMKQMSESAALVATVTGRGGAEDVAAAAELKDFKAKVRVCGFVGWRWSREALGCLGRVQLQLYSSLISSVVDSCLLAHRAPRRTLCRWWSSSCRCSPSRTR